MIRFVTALLWLVCLSPAFAEADNEALRSVTIRAPRDIGFFPGDLVRAEIDIAVDPHLTMDESSLPRPGPVTYWLDLRHITVAARSSSDGARRYTLRLLYQDFYNALDARQMEIPAFTLRFTDGKTTTTANVPPWGIGVSPLREVAPPPKEDPKDYLRADLSAPPVRSAPYAWGAAAMAILAALALVPLAADRAWFPFHQRPARAFASATRRLRALTPRDDDANTYMDALLILHRGIDQTHGERVLADDVPAFVARHRAYAPVQDGLVGFFAASRRAFFNSDPARAQRDLGFDGLLRFARQLAAIERTAA